MAKINNDIVYDYDESISDLDSFVGNNGDLQGKPTKTFSFGQLKTYVLSGLSPETGGNLKISEYVYIGVLTTPEEVVNAIIPAVTILPYEIFMVSVNGTKSLLKLQDTVVGDGETPTNSSHYITMQSEQGPQGEQGDNGIDGADGEDGKGIVSVAKTDTVGLIDTYTITYTDATTTNFAVTNGADGSGEDGADGLGITSIIKTGTVGLVDTYTITFTDTSTSTFTVTNGTDGEDGAPGKSILTLVKTGTVGLVDTYTITFTDFTTATFTVTNGKGITSIAKTGTVGLVDTYTITFNDATTSTFTVTNGADYTSNLQKKITYPADFTGTNYTVLTADNNYSILIDNGATDVTITVPTGLMAKIQVGFIQKGSGLVTFVESGTTLKYLTGLGLKMAGINANAYLEKEGSIEELFLFGNIKA